MEQSFSKEELFCVPVNHSSRWNIHLQLPEPRTQLLFIYETKYFYMILIHTYFFSNVTTVYTKGELFFVTSETFQESFTILEKDCLSNTVLLYSFPCCCHIHRNSPYQRKQSKHLQSTYCSKCFTCMYQLILTTTCKVDAIIILIFQMSKLKMK